MEGPSSSRIVEEDISGEGELNLLDLPRELWRYVAVNANYRDLMSLCTTSRALKKEICDNNAFWRDKTYHDFEGLYFIDEKTVRWRTLYETLRVRRTREFLKLARLMNTARYGPIPDEKAFRILEDDATRGILDLKLRDDEGRTPLIRAIRTSSPDIVEGLLELGANANAKDVKGNTPLIYATELRRLRILEDLLRYGANVNLQSRDGYTALMIASEFGYPRFAELLLNYGADPNLQIPFGTTALILASENGNLDVVRILLENGADVNLRDDWGRVGKGRTALDWADAKGHRDIVELLLEYGAGGALRRTSYILGEFAKEYGGL